MEGGGPPRSARDLAAAYRFPDRGTAARVRGSSAGARVSRQGQSCLEYRLQERIAGFPEPPFHRPRKVGGAEGEKEGES